MSIIGRILIGMIIVAAPLTSANALWNLDALAARMSDILTNKDKNPGGQYYRVCGDDKGKSRLAEYCIEDIFKPTNVQMLQATELAKLYAKTKNGHDIACSSDVRKSWNDDYIACSDGKHAYEFRFDDVYESLDNTIKESVAQAVCEMHGWRYDGKYMACYAGTGCSVLDRDLMPFGYKTKLVNSMNQPPYCQMDFASKGSDYQFKTAWDINHEKFKYLQLESGNDLLFLLRRYVERQMKAQGVTLKTFNCNKSFQTYYTGQVTNPKDDILSCWANGQQIDFLFDDMQESVNMTANGGTAGLQCIADVGGTFDGRNCHGLTRVQCNQIKDKVTGGTEWNDELDTCVFKAAASADKLDTVIDVTATAGFAVGMVVLSGGTGWVLAVAVVGATAESAAAGARVGMEKQARDILADSYKCACYAGNEYPACAKRALGPLIDVVTWDNVDGNARMSAVEEISRLFECIPAEDELFDKFDEVKTGEFNKLSNFKNWSSEKKLEWIADTIGTAAAMVELGHGAVKLAQNIKSLFSGAQNVSKLDNLTINLARRVEKIQEARKAAQLGKMGRTGHAVKTTTKATAEAYDLYDKEEKVRHAATDSIGSLIPH